MGPPKAGVSGVDGDLPSAVPLPGLSFSSMDLSIALLEVTRGECHGEQRLQDRGSRYPEAHTVFRHFLLAAVEVRPFTEKRT